jgi:hypothetical protein
VDRHLPLLLRLAALILAVIALPSLLNFAYKYYLPVGDEYALELEEDFPQVFINEGHALPTKTPFAPLFPTLAPFRPAQANISQAVQKPLAATATPAILEIPVGEINLAPQAKAFSSSELGDFFGINFIDRQKRITIKIIPSNKRVNGGKPITISFIPGKKCEFGNKRACVNNFYTPADGQVTFLSIHSGVGGEAQHYRSAIEGTGLDQALFSLKQVQANLNALTGSEVVINQGDERISGLRIAAITRIPAKSLRRYINADLNSALEIAASLDSEFEQTLQTNQPQVVFETCGWRMPGEPASNGVSSTSASIYLTVIQKVQ